MGVRHGVMGLVVLGASAVTVAARGEDAAAPVPAPTARPSAAVDRAALDAALPDPSDLPYGWSLRPDGPRWFTGTNACQALDDAWHRTTPTTNATASVSFQGAFATVRLDSVTFVSERAAAVALDEVVTADVAACLTQQVAVVGSHGDEVLGREVVRQDPLAGTTGGSFVGTEVRRRAGTGDEALVALEWHAVRSGRTVLVLTTSNVGAPLLAPGVFVAGAVEALALPSDAGATAGRG